MLKEIAEEVLKDLLDSKALGNLMSNKRFIDAITMAIKTKEEVEGVIRSKVRDILKIMDIPSKSEVASYEKRVHTIEKELDRVIRQMMKKKAGRRSKKRRK